MIRRIYAIIKKELRHIIRDPKTLIIIFAMPVMMVIIYGYALNMDVKHIKIGIVDQDNSQVSRTIISAFAASDYFNIRERPQSASMAGPLFKARKVKAVIVIPDDFGEDLRKTPQSKIQLLVDGSDPTVGMAVENYSTAIISAEIQRYLGIKIQSPVEIRERYLYNTELEGSAFIIPGLVAVILMMVCALLTSITIAREKETGTMDVLLVSPVKPIEIIFGKVVPYIVLSLLDGVFILISAKLLFDIPLNGNLFLLFALSILFVYCSLGIGLFISSVAPSQQVAMLAALVATIMPSILLSGFIFPIFSMPEPIKVITFLVPAKYYIEIIRGILMKASTFDVLKTQALYLFLLGTFFIIIATARFKTRAK